MPYLFHFNDSVKVLTSIYFLPIGGGGSQNLHVQLRGVIGAGGRVVILRAR